MNLEQKIGQLLVIGFDGTEVNEHIETLIRDYHAGNIILFERNCHNPEQIFKLTQDLQRIAMESNGVPLFITIDQENGMVARIYDGVTLFPGNMAQTAGGSLEDTYKIGYYTGEGLEALGVNYNLAPSVDINNNPKNPVIGVRSFGEEREVVAQRAGACIKGLQDAGVIATAKHFPGHGDTHVDSHLDLPTIVHDEGRLEEIELYPFREAIKNGVKSIMSAHVKFPAYEPQDLPGTLSRNVLTGLLRQTLGFEGIIITDCMEMNAIATYYGTHKATPMAIHAGADLVCISHSKERQIKAVEEIKKAIEEGWLAVEQINESVERIVKEKSNLKIDEFLNRTYEQAKQKLYDQAAQKHAKKVANQSITLIRGGELLPISAKKVLVVAPNSKVLTGADGTKVVPNFAEYYKAQVKDKDITSVIIDNRPTKAQIEEVAKQAAQHEVVILCTYNANLVQEQIELAQCIYNYNENVVLIPMRNPYDIQLLPEISTCIVPYEYTYLSMQSLVEVLNGEIQPKGSIPISL